MSIPSTYFGAAAAQPLHITGVAMTVFLLLFLHRKASRSGASSLPLPPGPPKLPIIGHVFQMPKSYEWVTYSKWSKDLNTDIIYLNLAGTSVIVLHSLEAANELLDKRSTIYSDRPPMPMVKDLMGWDFHMALMEYGKEWRILRTMFHQDFKPAALPKYVPTQQKARRHLLCRLLEEPENFVDHIHHTVGAVIMSVTYGIDIHPKDDPYVRVVEDAGARVTYAIVPGRFLVDLIPVLKYVPEWLPGGGFKKWARESRKLCHQMLELPFAEAKRKIESGTSSASLVKTFSDTGNDPKLEHRVKLLAAAMYSGGVETQIALLSFFFLAMLASPAAQARAQAELDRMVGCGRLPELSDEKALPYVGALIREVFRWITLGPIGVPHYSQVEDEYKGYRIPAKSIVLVNLWKIFHDEDRFPDPHTFKPERWLTADGQLDSEKASLVDPVFGFGRRACAGRDLAYTSSWLTIASILATLNITKAVDENGNVVEPSYGYTSSAVATPLPFKCQIKPRSVGAKKLIMEGGQADDVGKM